NDALQFAGTGCHASADWGAALAGYAAHGAGRFSTADSAFAVALAAMTSEERCRWADLSPIVGDPTARRVPPQACPALGALARRILRLGSPLYSVSSTDLYTEHLARVTRGKIAEQSATVDGVAWADDQRTLTIRYGFPRWYSRSMPPSGSMMATESITGHDSG